MIPAAFAEEIVGIEHVVRDRRERNRHLADRALADFHAWQQTL